MAETAAILTADSLIEVVSITVDDEGNPVTNNLPIRVKLQDIADFVLAQVPEPETP